jgi:hypothetical protein
VLVGDTSAEQHAERLGFLTPPESLLAGTGTRLIRARVGDSGERRKPHPVQEIESNSTFPMALPFFDDLGADDGDA